MCINPSDFTYLELELEDTEDEDIYQYFEKCLEFIESSNKVYIHCNAGVCISATIAIAYLMWKNNLNYEEAFKFVIDLRPQINPSENCINQLKNKDSHFFYPT